MAKKWTYSELEEFGRIRLSDNFYMREFLHSEIAQSYGLTNAPNDSEAAIRSGRMLCTRVLEPLQKSWGKIHVRSGYRSPEVNTLGNQKKLNCANNTTNAAAHIWDERDSLGFQGATACIVIPAYQDYYESTLDWASLAWWIDSFISNYYELCFFKKQCAFNIRWYEGNDNRKTIKTFVSNPDTDDKSFLINKGKIHPHYQSQTPVRRYKKAAKLLKL